MYCLATFLVYRNPDGTIRLQNVGDPNHWLRVNNTNELDGKGSGNILVLLNLFYFFFLLLLLYYYYYYF